MPLPSNTRHMLPVVCLCAVLLYSGCSSKDSPPYYRAEITNVYREQTTVEHFRLLYWWEERGETPFLKPHSLEAKEVIVEVLEPLKNDPTHVTVKTEHIAFDNLDSVEIILTETGKHLVITTRDGRSFRAETSFPKSLKIDKQSGFADMKIFALGIKQSGDKTEDFKMALDYVKKIRILQKTDQ